MERLPSFVTCYFCGTQNRQGFGIRYDYDPNTDQVEGFAEPDEDFCGYPGILHGGIQSALLDDVMYWAVSHRTATSSVTVELRCRFVNVARLGQRFVLRARAHGSKGRKTQSEGWLLDEAGDIVAEASGLYLIHSRDVFESRILPLLDFEGCSDAMVSRYKTGAV